MTFNEMVLACEAADTSFDATFDKCVAFVEASYNEYKTNIKEAELKVINESGTPDDLIYLEDAASEGFLVRSAKAIEKIVESFLKWMGEKIEAIKSFFNSKKTKDTLDKAEKVCDKNPEFKNKKVQIPDYKARIKVCDEYESKVDKKLAAMNAGHYSSSDKEDLKKIEKDFDADAAKTKVAMVTVTVAGALAAAKFLYDKSQDKDIADIKPTKGTGDHLSDPDNTEAYTNAVVDKFKIKRERSNAIFASLTAVIGNALHGLAGEGQVEPSLEPEKEEKNDAPTEESVMNAEVQESYINDILDSLNTKEEPVAEEVKPTVESAEEGPELGDESPEHFEAEESTEDTADKEIDAYLESVCDELFGDKYTEVKMESEFDAEKELEAIEAALPEEEEVSAEEYLEAMEAELFPEEEPVAESADDEDKRLNAILDEITSNL